jgi:hypothetical protein
LITSYLKAKEAKTLGVIWLLLAFPVITRKAAKP